jgi:hypothetical protein
MSLSDDDTQSIQSKIFTDPETPRLQHYYAHNVFKSFGDVDQRRIDGNIEGNGLT